MIMTTKGFYNTRYYEKLDMQHLTCTRYPKYNLFYSLNLKCLSVNKI